MLHSHGLLYPTRAGSGSSQHVWKRLGLSLGAQQRRISQSGGKLLVWAQGGSTQHVHSMPGSAGPEQAVASTAPGGGAGGGGGGGEGGSTVKLEGKLELSAELDESQLDGVP